jgi:uncharacterized protein YjbJ (UPF0337 family)
MLQQPCSDHWNWPSRKVGARIEQVKGQGKETVGAITGDKDLEAEGKTDRWTG